MSKVFNRVGRVRPRRNMFNLSYRKNFTCNMGQLVPVMCDEVVPGDFFKIGNQLTVRFQPLAAPIMHEISATVHYFFVPTRLIWGEWEDFISNGENPVPYTLPRMSRPSQPQLKGSLWDYFGFPISQSQSPDPPPTTGATPLAFPWYAYNFIMREYYLDEEIDSDVIKQLEQFPSTNKVQYRRWSKDYFTSARISRQRGQTPALPVNVDSFRFDSSGFGPRDYVASSQLFRRDSSGYAITPPFTKVLQNGVAIGSGDPFSPQTQGVKVNSSDTAAVGSLTQGTDVVDVAQKLIKGLGASATTFNVSDLRLAFQVQKWLERNSRAGIRYTSFLQSHFGVSPSDARLDRPEYIGGTKCPIQISEVLQTSQTTEGSGGSPLGEFAGHGLAADSHYAGSYNVQEFGYIIGIMSVMPKPAYQDGINRQWLRRMPTDFYFPEFAHLSEQGIYNAEVFAARDDSSDYAVWGFAGQYDEMRVKHDMVCGDMRRYSESDPQLSYWNLTRKFYQLPPLNTTFISTEGQIREDIFLVQSLPNQPLDHLIVNCQNIIQAVRPLPLIAEPGLIDHF